jgi:tRNA-specific adenosine deaminase 1
VSKLATSKHRQDGDYMMEVSGDEIADVVLQQFEKLPQKRKPQDRGEGIQEWVPLSGIVAQGKLIS